MLPKKLLLVTGLICYAPVLFSQVGINTTTPDAQFDVRSSNQATPAPTDGILIPRIDAFPATNPTAAQQGMMVYLTTAAGTNQPGFYYWDQTTTSWVGMATGKNWDLMGNAATNPATQFFGTTDSQPLSIRTNNTERLRIDANGNIGIATASPQSKLHLYNGASGLTPNVFSPAIIEGSGLTYLNVLSNSETGVVFGSGGTGTNGGIVYNSGIYTNGMNFRTGGNQNRMNISSTGQVSIGNALANARLQILSSSQASPANTDGIIIPKVDAFPATNPTASQQAMMVYLTTASGSNQPGFYYWDNPTASWIGIVSTTNGDADWYEEGTTKAPNAITDDIFHMGHVAIGKNTTNYPLEVDNTTHDRAIAITTNYTGVASAFGISNTMTGAASTQQNALINAINNSGDGSHMGVQNTLSGTGTGAHYGVVNNLVGTGTGTQYGMSTNMSNSGTGVHFGISNVLSGAGTGGQFGIATTINNSGNGSHYGSYNTFSGTGSGVHIGSVNLFSGLGSGDNIGMSNDFSKAGAGDIQGTRNMIVGSGNGIYSGVETTITNNGSGPAYGSSTQISGTSAGNKYGYFSYIDPTAGGVHTGIYSEVLKPGGNNFAGYFLGKVGIGTSGANLYTMPAVRGTNDQVMQTDAAGNVSWKNPNVALNAYAWGTTGNSGTNPATHFIGTTDDNDLVFKRNSLGAGKIGTTNTAFGVNSLSSNTGGTFNVAVGASALATNDIGNYSVAMGYNALLRNRADASVGIGTSALENNTSGQYNTAIGTNTLHTNDTGNSNTATGYNALYDNTGSYNTAVGVSAVSSNSVGESNVGIGFEALRTNKTGSWNTALGSGALFSNFGGEQNTAVGQSALHSSASGIHNVSVGMNSLYNNTSGSRNTALGTGALYWHTNGSDNTALGMEALNNQTAGSNNIAVGKGANVPLLTGSDQLSIGNVVFGTGMNTMASAKIAIADDTPDAKLEITASNAATPANTDGILIPRVNAFPVTNPTAAQNGMMIFLTTILGQNVAGFYYWDHAAVNWVAVGSKSSWSISGNSGTSPVTNFIGTNDNAALAVRTNGSERMRVSPTGDVGIKTINPTAELEVNGFTKLGSTAPAVKMIKLTGITPGTQGLQTLILHGLNGSKILGVSVFVEQDCGVWNPAQLYVECRL